MTISLSRNLAPPKQHPWHQDAPYYFVDGKQTISFWIPIDPVGKATLRCIKGSHKWDKFVLPTRWLKEDNFYAENSDFLPVPDPDAEPDNYDVLEWQMEPGDAIAFDYRCVHGARGNMADTRRRALSLRYVGDDALHNASRPHFTAISRAWHDRWRGFAQRLVPCGMAKIEAK